MADRSKISAKIAALRAKTSAAGCTEAEALAAAELAAQLMAEHGLSEADIEMVTASAKERTSRPTWRSTIAASVSMVTNTASVMRGGEGQIDFIGRDPGPEIAAYLYVVLVRAVEREVKAFKDSTPYRRRRTIATKRAAVADFSRAMVLRLHTRLCQLFRSSIDEAATQLAERARADRYPVLRNWGPAPEKNRFADAAGAGWRAGGDVTLAHGVAGADGRPLAIGGGSHG